MNINTQIIDKLAITISGLCIAHCLIIPALIVLAPSLITLGLTSESFHLWMVMAVIPSSIYALVLGCKKHAKIYIVVIGALGLSCLLLALLLSPILLNEIGEKILTVIGALLIVFSHVKNFKLCRTADNCLCHSTD